MGIDDEVVLELPPRVSPVRHARSTLIIASIQTLRNRGLFEEYDRTVPPEHRETLLGAIAGTWIPLVAALAHYKTCDTFGLAPEQQYINGRGTFDGARGTILGTAVRMARGAGITPWNALVLSQRFWLRGLDGGGVRVLREGPKDAHVTIVECGLVQSPYFRNGFRGLTAGIMELFCTRSYVTERKARRPNSLEMRIQWA
jgi:hypothetical protein